MLRVFISSTSVDLTVHRRVAHKAIGSSQWHATWMEDFPSSTQPTADQCVQFVKSCDLLLLILAFRFGSQPPNSSSSYTMCEVKAAREHGIPIRALMAKDNWPWNLWDADAEARQRMADFRGSWGSIAEFFEYEAQLADVNVPLPSFAQLVRKVMNDHRDQISQLKNELNLPLLGYTADQRFSLLSVLRELQSLIDGRVLCPVDAIRDAYQAYHPRRESLPHRLDSVVVFADAVKSLVSLPPSETSSHPLFLFLTDLANSIGGEVGCLLLGCLSKAGLTPQPIPIREPLAKTQRRPTSTCRVLVRFDSTPRGHRVFAWVCRSGQSEKLPLEKELWTAANRQVRLAELHGEVLRHAPPRGTILEFVVPRDLINEEFDQWKMATTKLGYIGRIIDDFPVIVRSLERVRVPQALANLVQRWDKLAARFGEPCYLSELVKDGSRPGPRAIWVAHGDSGEQLFRQLSVDLSVGCAILNRAPRKEFPRKAMDVFKALLLRGVPVILWPRKHAKGAGVREELARLVNGLPLPDLPRRIHHYRCGQEVVSTTPSHVTLIWDDPTQPVPDPDDSPLISPAGV